MATNQCTECEDHSCPGVMACPQCGVGEHGVEAETHISDHGKCRDCHVSWMMGDYDEPFSDGDDYHCMNCGESFDYWEVRGPSTLKQVGLRCPMCENTEILGPKRGDGDGD